MVCTRGLLLHRLNLYEIALFLSDTADTLLTNILAPVGNQTSGACAEHTGGLILLENNPIILHINLQLIPLCDVQSPAKFNW